MKITRKDIALLAKVSPHCKLTTVSRAPRDCDGTCKGSCESTATNR